MKAKPKGKRSVAAWNAWKWTVKRLREDTDRAAYYAVQLRLGARRIA